MVARRRRRGRLSTHAHDGCTPRRRRGISDLRYFPALSSKRALGEHQNAQEPSQRAPWPRLGPTHTPHAAQLVRMCVRLMQSDPRVTPSSALYSPLRRNFPRADPNPSNGLPVSPFSRLWLTGPTAGPNGPGPCAAAPVAAIGRRGRRPTTCALRPTPHHRTMRASPLPAHERRHP